MSGRLGETLLTEQQIINRCAELGAQISSDANGEPLIVVGLLNGCIPFVAELIKHLTVTTYIDFIRVKSYYSGTSSGELKIINDLELDVKGKNVLLVDDIIDSGKTMVNLVRFLKIKGAKNVRVCALLNKPTAHSEEVDNLTLDYIGFDIENTWVVGFGLDCNELYRNLPYIAVYYPNE